jgi:hypothetical protein
MDIEYQGVLAMPYYRALDNLYIGNRLVRKGSILQRAFSQQQIDALVTVGAIAPVRTPPLAQLPGWTTRAKRLEAHGISTASDFLETDNRKLADWLRVKQETIARYKREIIDTWLQPDDKQSGS